MNTIRYGLGLVDNPTGPNRYEQGSMARFNELTGRGYSLSGYVQVVLVSFVIMYQGEGYIYDGCYGRDHWCYYDATAEDGSYVGSFGGPSTYNTERGYNNGTFLTYGNGYSWTYCRPNSNHNFVSYSSAPYNCRAFYISINIQQNNVNVMQIVNYFAYAGGDQYVSYNFQSSVYSYDRVDCWLTLWY